MLKGHPQKSLIKVEINTSQYTLTSHVKISNHARLEIYVHIVIMDAIYLFRNVVRQIPQNIKELTIQKYEQSWKRKLSHWKILKQALMEALVYPGIKNTKDVYLLVLDDMDMEILCDLDIFSKGSNT